MKKNKYFIFKKSNIFSNKGLTFKFIFFLSMIFIPIFSVILLVTYDFSKKMIERNVEENSKNLTYEIINRIENIFISTKKVPETITYFLSSDIINHPDFFSILAPIVKNNPEIYSATIAFEPNLYKKDKTFFAPYYYKVKDQVHVKYLGSKNYYYFNYDWYQIPRELQKSFWSEPYYDDGGLTIMTTYAIPFYRTIQNKKQFLGVITADISLKWLSEIIADIKVLKTGYAFLITKNGTFITHPNKNLIMHETIFTVAEARGDLGLRKIGQDMIHGKTGFIPFYDFFSKQKCWLYYAPIPSTGWTVAILFPQAELMRDIKVLTWTVSTLGVIGLFLIMLALSLVVQSIIKPLRDMAKATELLGTGNLNIELPKIKSKDEVGKLYFAFQNMQYSLQNHIDQLTQTTAIKERIQSELRVATEIQANMLPRIFPAFPGRKEFDIFASMQPAKEVGGDLYDFFLISENKLCFLIGDVSGKGVPAALFMVITKILLKNEALQNYSAEEILTRVNNILYPENEASMFITIFLAILDIKTGEVTYANAGHNPPLFFNGEQFSYLTPKREFVLGPIPNVQYHLSKLQLKPGDVLFLYTDGITEAMNPELELFSDERLLTTINTLIGKSIKEIVSGINAEICTFARDAEQADDITMLTIQYFGNNDRK